MDRDKTEGQRARQLFLNNVMTFYMGVNIFRYRKATDFIPCYVVKSIY
jgi:hypothetical protein